MTYREELPAGCPPETAWEITQETVVYRVVKNQPASLEDFHSQRALQPTKPFAGVSECEARGLSVFTESQDASRLLLLPKFRVCHVFRVTLNSGAGMVAPTFRPSHHTWRPLADYDILSRCQLEAA
ncbi:MAG: hypothetical protein Q8M07_04205 [Prosthecobacter sp.]|nr:hypothetical protein [Prosthecobacter sp.]